MLHGVKSSRALALTITVVLWASAFPAIRAGLDGLDGLDGLGVAGLSLLRLSVASAALALAAPLVGVRSPRRHDLPLIALCGLTGMSAYQVLLNWGETRVPAGAASLLISIAPVFAALQAGGFLGERVTGRMLAGSAIAIGGAALITSGASGMASADALLVLAAAVAQGAYHVAIKPLLRRYSGFEVACYAMWSGTVFLLPLAPTAVRALVAAPPSALGAAVYLGLGPSALGFVTWGYAIARGSVARAAAALYLVPPVAFLVAFAWLGEKPHLTELAGGLLGVAGVTLVNRSNARPDGGVARGSRRQAQALAAIAPAGTRRHPDRADGANGTR